MSHQDDLALTKAMALARPGAPLPDLPAVVETLVETIPALRAEVEALRAENRQLSTDLKWTALELDRCRAHGQELQAENERLSNLNRLYHNQIVLMQQAEGEAA